MDKLDKILEKIDKVESHVGGQAITLAKLTVSVEDHIRRTNLLEEDFKPVKKHVAMVEGALKFIGLLGILATIFEAFKWMHR